MRSRARVSPEALVIEPPRNVLSKLPPLTSLARPGPAETLTRNRAGELIAINGVGVATVEEQLRPGRASVSGFLGHDERLVDVLERDRAYLASLGLTAEKMAHLLDHAVAALGRDFTRRAGIFELNGATFMVHRVTYRGFQQSPFADGCSTPHDYTVVNLSRGLRMTFSGLMPELIGRYGFFEGNVEYRLAPHEIAQVFGLIEGGGKDGEPLWSGIAARALRGLLPPDLQDALKYEGPHRSPFEPPPSPDERVVARLVKAVRRAPNVGTYLDEASAETLVRNCLAGSESHGVEGEALYRQLAQRGAPETLIGVRAACDVLIASAAPGGHAPMEALSSLTRLLANDPALADLSDEQQHTLRLYITSVRGAAGLTPAQAPARRKRAT
ncbi:MAG: hypothetical protein ACAI38_09575 [Myxococcota bacterium]|nr:hypothetical protein [Myxococcota bacterium]